MYTPTRNVEWMDQCEGGAEAESLSSATGSALAQELKNTPWHVSSAAIHMAILILALILWPVIQPPSENDLAMTVLPPDPPLEPIETTPPEPTPELTPTEVTVETPVEVPVEVPVEMDVEMAEEQEVAEAAVMEDSVEDLAEDDAPPALLGIGRRGGSDGAKFNGTKGRLGRKMRARRVNPHARITENAVDRALRWLAMHQSVDGSWDCATFGGGQHDTAVTALALLAFLGNGNSSRFGTYRRNVAAAQGWLLRQQRADGHVGPFRYEAAIALMALCEAYGMSEEYALAAPVQRAVDAACRSQNPDGGWRYTPGSGLLDSASAVGPGGKASDTSVTGWWVMGLKAAKTAKLNVPQATWSGVHRYFQAVGVTAGEGAGGAREGLAGNAGSGSVYGAVGLYQPGGKVTPVCTSAVMCCGLFLGLGRDDPRVRGCATTLIEESLGEKCFLPGARTGQGAGSQNFYLWYYESLGFFQLGADDPAWLDFNPKMVHELTTTQRMDGTFAQYKGSWDCNNGHSFHGGDRWGRVGQTAVGALMLEVYYRFERVAK